MIIIRYNSQWRMSGTSKAGKSQTGSREQSKVIAIRMHEDLGSRIDVMLDAVQMFNNRPEFTMFAIRDYYMSLVQRMDTRGSNFDAAVEKLRAEILLNKALYDEMRGDITQYAIRLPPTFYKRLHLITILTGVKLQDLIKSSIMVELKRMENVELDVRLSIRGAGGDESVGDV